MRAKWFLMFVASVLVSLVGCGQQGSDAERLQGTWTVESAEKQAPEKIKGLRAVVKGDSFCFRVGDKDLETAIIKLDPTKMPKTIDFQPATPGKTEKRPSLGIYELKGNTLKLCWRKEGAERPTEFAAKADDDVMLMTLKRD
jgi:uncharacterized protein (TIGR03067 family)